MREKRPGFWQISSKVPPGVITSVTKNCDREDCMLSAKVGESTCMASSNHYDKAGRLHIEDRNSMYAEVTCAKCWGSWTVYHSPDHVDVKEICARKTEDVA